MASPPVVETIRLPGQSDYNHALELQTARVQAVEQGHEPSALFLLEHSPVITLGRKWHKENLLKSEEELHALGIDVFPATRGGDVTYHGPGQLIAYPVLDLRLWKKSIRWYLRSLEEVLIRTVARYGLSGERVDGLTGVWVGGAKVAAIGIGIHNWVTYHGVALNVAPNLAHFGLIIPCGIAGKPVTSLEQLIPNPPSMEQAAVDFENAFRDIFQQALSRPSS
ncbi:MAG: lipoyl(octanoyl) transferase LipB [Candidatus Hydrogenedentes bacterium]|nr:lipoyl(octanoyl) transferase LipB [Candidatus Hydrogenedentota bacterium]